MRLHTGGNGPAIASMLGCSRQVYRIIQEVLGSEEEHFPAQFASAIAA